MHGSISSRLSKHLLMTCFRFILCDPAVSYDQGLDGYEDDNEEIEELKEEDRKHKQALLEKINFDKLTPEQKELCIARRTLLMYLDRLSTYEVKILAHFSLFFNLKVYFL